jgi:DNA (cytosine-5)-methyltransferase 1
MSNLTGASLFAGIGGFDLALENNGIKIVAQVEIDKKAQEVLRSRFPNSALFGDVTEVSGKDLIGAGFEPSNGIITGGFPCQDLSIAGTGIGLIGKRSKLFWEIIRILEETQAKYFIIENVPGLLKTNQGRDMEIVISTLAKLGYSVAWRVLDAQYFGLPQRRKRIFIVGSLADRQGAFKILFESNGVSGDTDQSKPQRQKTLSDPSSNIREPDAKWFIKVKRPQSKEDYETWIEGEVHPTLNSFDNGSVRSVAVVLDGSKVRRLTPIEHERLQGFPDNWTEGQADSNRYKQIGNAVAVPVVDWITKRLVDYHAKQA